MTTNELDLTADIIDIRDIIERYEAIEESIDGKETDERAQLEAIIDELKGQGGDEQWRGDWYPLTLIREDYFATYARELVQDVGDLPKGLPAYLVIDWEATARNLIVDYASVEIDGTTYWFR